MPSYRVPDRKDWLITGLMIGVFTAAIVLGAYLFGESHPFVLALLVCAMLLVLVRWHAATSACECPKCGHQFEVSTRQDLVSPHSLTTKYLCCPKCRERDWARVLRKA